MACLHHDSALILRVPHRDLVMPTRKLHVAVLFGSRMHPTAFVSMVSWALRPRRALLLYGQIDHD